uniref:Uncharacterized protein n=1 Tax=Desulfacinum infernum TaxID=35837 RepID=A0A832A5P1_9BACT
MRPRRTLRHGLWTISWVGSLGLAILATSCAPLPLPNGGLSIGTLDTSGPNVYVNGRPAQAGEIIRDGMRVSTGPGSSARIRFFDDGYCQLDENTDPWFRIDRDPITNRKCLYIEVGFGQVYIIKHDVCFHTPDVSGTLNSEVNLKVEADWTELALFAGQARIDRPPGVFVGTAQLAVFSKGQLVQGLRRMSEKELQQIPAWIHGPIFDAKPPPPPKGWCCAEGRVFPASPQECQRRRGFFSYDRDDVEQRCQRQGWCCLNGKVFPASPQQCKSQGGFFSFDRDDVEQRCQRQGWCCLNGKVFPASPQQCKNQGGFFSYDRDDVEQRCQRQGWCCLNGKVFPASPQDCERRRGFFSFDRDQVEQRCQRQGWCCLNGKVFPASPQQCKNRGGFFSYDENQARARCGPD